MSLQNNAFQLTDEQLQAVKVVCKPDFDRLKILAYAGAGKTSTIVVVAKELERLGLRGIYLAFNKAIAVEAGAKLPRSCDAKTFHGLAYNNVPKTITAKLKKGTGFFANTFTRFVGSKGMVLVTGDATERQVNGKPNTTVKLDDEARYLIVKHALNYFMRSDDDEVQDEHIAYAINYVLNIDVPTRHLSQLVNSIKPQAVKVWQDFISSEGQFRITHDVYLKLYAMSKPIIPYDYILFDESQDTDNLMLGILKLQKCRIIFVGDPYQQIYDWRGAVDAMSKFDGDQTTLTKSFRFGEAIAKPANMLLDYLGADKPLVGAGKVGFVDAENTNPVRLTAILARTNAGVIQSALSYYEHFPDKHIFIELNGKPEDMLKVFKALDAFKVDSRNNTLHKDLANFNTYDELKTYCEHFSGEEISQCLRLYEKYGLAYLVETIAKFKNDNNPDIVVTTAHKSKGREWDYVLIHSDFEESQKGVLEAHESEEDIYDEEAKTMPDSEVRLLYVALTRPKLGLYVGNITRLLAYIEDNVNDSLTQESDTLERLYDDVVYSHNWGVTD